MSEYELHTQGASHRPRDDYDGMDPNRNRAPQAGECRSSYCECPEGRCGSGLIDMRGEAARLRPATAEDQRVYDSMAASYRGDTIVKDWHFMDGTMRVSWQNGRIVAVEPAAAAPAPFRAWATGLRQPTGPVTL